VAGVALGEHGRRLEGGVGHLRARR
jgi:hypothetical protein